MTKHRIIYFFPFPSHGFQTGAFVVSTLPGNKQQPNHQGRMSRLPKAGWYLGLAIVLRGHHHWVALVFGALAHL